MAKQPNKQLNKIWVAALGIVALALVVSLVWYLGQPKQVEPEVTEEPVSESSPPPVAVASPVSSPRGHKTIGELLEQKIKEGNIPADSRLLYESEEKEFLSIIKSVLAAKEPEIAADEIFAVTATSDMGGEIWIHIVVVSRAASNFEHGSDYFTLVLIKAPSGEWQLKEIRD